MMENSRNSKSQIVIIETLIEDESSSIKSKSIEDIPSKISSEKEPNSSSNLTPINSYIRRASTRVLQIHRESKMVAIGFWTSFRGIIFASCASLLFSINATIVKHLTGINPALIALFRFGEIIILSIATFQEMKIDSIIGPPNCRIWVILRGFTGATSLYLRYMTIQLLPLANATVITQSVPVFVCVFAHIFLKEACGIFHVIALTITLIGIGFTAKLDAIFGTSLEGDFENIPNGSTQLMGLVCGLAAAIVGSLTFIVLRKLKDVHHSVVLFNFAWVASIEMAVITYFMDGYSLPEGGASPWLLMLVGVFSYYAQIMFTKALQVEEAGIVAMFKSSCDLVLAFIFQICLFQKIPDFCTILGSVLVSSAVLFTSFRKYIITLPPDHVLRRYFDFILK